MLLSRLSSLTNHFCKQNVQFFASIIQTSHMIPVSSTDEVHLKQLIRDDVDPLKTPAIFCLHGAISNGKLFYPKSNTGFKFFFCWNFRLNLKR